MKIAATVSALALLVAGGLLAAPRLAPAQNQALDAAKRDYARPSPRPVENRPLVALGRDLFFDPRISASGKTACASCHVPAVGWVVADPRPINDSGKPTARKSQPLIGIGYAAAPLVGWDGRNPNLETQTKASIATGSMSMRETGMPVKVETIEARINSPGDIAKFAAALPGQPINIDTIALALGAFERTIEPPPTPFDQWVEGKESAIPEAAKRGFALFTGKAGCSACHSGWRFTDDRFHDIGTDTTDRGRGAEVKDAKLDFAFKTPTLRSVALRAPYMHNGSITTLGDVVRHYEKGGIDRPSRSPLLLPIRLTDQERLDLVAFMEQLTGAAETPVR
jgi:cytochrome c peroxidase